jgi:SagB-type dehydrogenase family enzyme
MSNRDTDALWHYHNETKHSYRSVRASGHRLDWSNYPVPFKIYPGIESIPLPREWTDTGADALAAVSSTGAVPETKATPDLKTLATILYHSAGVTRRREFAGGEIYFRAAACTGALYEVELYLVCGGLADLEAGLYHFNPADFALGKLRSGDWRGVLARATADDPAIVRAPVTIISTGTYWRNAWKYQARTYRHFFWDNGTMLANLLAMAAAERLPARLVMGFLDEEVNDLLGLDTQREVAISMVALGSGSQSEANTSRSIEPLKAQAAPPSGREVDYPLMREAHAASSLTTVEEVREWRGWMRNDPAQAGPVRPPEPEPAGTIVELKPLAEAEAPLDGIEQVIRRRGSTRRFARASISFAQLSTMLMGATQGIPADFLDPEPDPGGSRWPEGPFPGGRLNDLYVIANAVEGLASGAYYLRRDRPAIELLKQGDFRAEAGYLGLEQELPADAAAAIFFLADLKAIFARFGNRGYRAAQIEAGIIGGKLYLAAYAQRIGATGLTFYDDDVTSFFSPHAAGKSAIFLLAVGIPARRVLRTL